MLNTTIKEENGNFTFILEGKIDALTSMDLGKKFEEVFPAAKSMTLDVKDVDYISSAGLGIILTAQQYMEGKDLPDVKVINIGDMVKEIFMMTGFDELVDAEM